MLFTETRLKGAFIIQLEKRGDERGFSPALSAKKNLPITI